MLLSFNPQLYYDKQNIERSFKINTQTTNKKGSEKRRKAENRKCFAIFWQWIPKANFLKSFFFYYKLTLLL